MPTETELRETMADSCRILFKLGLVDYMGHPSVRIPGTSRILIKPRHSEKVRSYAQLTADDMVVIDIDGKPLEGKEPPPGERFIHTSIYKARPDVQAVVHTHQPWATMMGAGNAPIRPILHVQSELVAEDVPVWPCAMLVTNEELGRPMAQALGSHRVLHLQGHGIAAAGRTLEEATIDAIHLEQLAEANWRVYAMSREPRIIPPREIQQRLVSGVTWQVRWACYKEMAGIGV